MANYYAGVGGRHSSALLRTIRREKVISAKALNPSFLSSVLSNAS